MLVSRLELESNKLPAFLQLYEAAVPKVQVQSAAFLRQR